MMAAALSSCPMCSAPAMGGAAECLSCGAIFAKVLEKKERERRQAEAALQAAQAPPPAAPPFDRRKARMIAISAVCAWMAGLALYYHAAMREPRPRRPVIRELDSSARLRDPDTGRLGSVDVHLSPASPRPELPPAAGEPEAPPGVPVADPDFDD